MTAERRKISLKHYDGDELRPEFSGRWIEDRLKRIQEYWNLGDYKRVKEEVDVLHKTIEDKQIPETAFYEFS